MTTHFKGTIALFAPACFAMLLYAPAAQARTGSGDGIDQLKAADTNHDGKITRPEFTAYRASQWSRLDRNKDGYFTRDDLPGFAKSRWESGPRIVEIRQKFDSNHDGRISRAEFDNGPTLLFDAADVNHDNVVTEAEVRALAARKS